MKVSEKPSEKCVLLFCYLSLNINRTRNQHTQYTFFYIYIFKKIYLYWN